MKKTKNNYQVLDKNQDGDIELVEFNHDGKPKYSQTDKHNDYLNYVDEDPNPNGKQQPPPPKTQQVKKRQPPSQQQQRPNQNIRQGQYPQQPVPPPYTNYPIRPNNPQVYVSQGGYGRSRYNYNYRPTVVHINPYQQQQMRQSQQQQQQRSVIPDMQVQCNHCTFAQKVPGNTQVYVCCCCNNMSECYPLYGLFVCGKCQARVSYPYGTSDMIKCTRCNTVNSVPSEPQKKYSEGVGAKKQQISSQEKKEQSERFQNELDILLDADEQPQRPKNNPQQSNSEPLEEDEILFNDHTLPRKTNDKKPESGYYPDI